MRWWNKLTGRHCHATGYVHAFREATKEESPEFHDCDGDYCHHWFIICIFCGKIRLDGFAVEEIR